MDTPQQPPQGTESRLAKFIGKDVRVKMRNSGQWRFVRVMGCCPVEPENCIMVKDFDCWGRPHKRQRPVRLADKDGGEIKVQIEVLEMPVPAKQ